MKTFAPAVLVAVLAIALAGTAEARVAGTGRGIGVVFSPDLSTPHNRALYEALGFAYFESSDWVAVVREIAAWNEDPARVPIETLIVESHGTNGHGLRLQISKRPEAARSYASVGALQEALAEAGVGEMILSACNSGRLLRPEIYRRLNRRPGDPLFLPPTKGVLDASPRFDPRRSRVDILRRKESFLETLAVVRVTELPECVRSLPQMQTLDDATEFAISTMLVQLLADDPALELVPAIATDALSGREFPRETIEALMQRFFA
ncbi:MAG: hypothetical protein ACYC9N_19685, partial [Thermoanaerobaculia bacterium]